MNPIQPHVDQALLPAGSTEHIIAETQAEYRDLPAVRTPKCQVITRWQLTPEERQKLLDGDDVFLTVLAAGPVQPVILTVGTIDWKPCPMCSAPDGEEHDYRCPLAPTKR